MELLQLLLDTKRPQIFAESAVAGDGSDWHATELHLLGDISIAAEVEVFDDGRHRGPIRHDTSFRGTLVFTCGALLASGHRTKTPDLMEVAPNGNLDQLAYNRLYSRRLRPVFNWIQKTAEDRQRNALVTIPGLGCGQFAGRFHGRLGPILQTALESLLAELAEDIPNVRVVIFDPYNECTDFERVFGNTGFRVRPLLTSRNAHPQLCPPQDYAEDGENLSECDLYSLVAWDQVSWPGNDFYAGSRATDDGVKAAATSSMHAITGIQGHYEPVRGMYLPPGQYLTWGDCVRHNKIRLRLGGPDIGVN
ncbi:MAG: hypothetical protein H6994_03730 [Pseudomonadales bacterium]|nr:hypothetical protein [Pseudomonadales bacterium]